MAASLTFAATGRLAVAEEYLPGDKVEAILGAEGETGVAVVKAGTTIVLKGRVKSARTKYLVWRLQQKFGNIIDLTAMEPEAFKKLQEIENSFSQELALSFDAEAQQNVSKHLQFRVVEGRLVVSGKANNAEDIERITKIAKVYDKDPVVNVEVRRDMIEIDAIFCRINRVNGNRFGTTGLQSATINLPNYGVTYNGSSPATNSFHDALKGDNGTYQQNGWNSNAGFNAEGVLNQLTSFFKVSEKDVKLLVRPHLSTLNGKEAIFHSGGQQPFTIATDNVQTIEWKDYGTKLTISPVLTTDNKIDVNVTIEFVIPLNDGQNRFTKFSHTGRAILEENQALVLSGLVQQLYSLDIARTPGISKVPLLNYFFGEKNRSHDQDEMVVVVMPRLTRPMEKGEMADSFRTSEESGKIVSEAKDVMGDVPELKANRRPVAAEDEATEETVDAPAETATKVEIPPVPDAKAETKPAEKK